MGKFSPSKISFMSGKSLFGTGFLSEPLLVSKRTFIVLSFLHLIIVDLRYLHRSAKVQGDGGVGLTLGGAHRVKVAVVALVRTKSVPLPT